MFEATLTVRASPLAIPPVKLNPKVYFLPSVRPVSVTVILLGVALVSVAVVLLIVKVKSPVGTVPVATPLK